MASCSLLDAAGETLAKAPVGGSCREEGCHFSNPYKYVFKAYIVSSKTTLLYLLSECRQAFFFIYFCLAFTGVMVELKILIA